MGTYTYLRIHATSDTRASGGSNRIGDELTFRKVIQDALARSFGVSGAGTYVDVLHFRPGIIKVSKEDGDENTSDVEIKDAVIRVAREDSQRIKAALASAPISTCLSIVDESDFLPALLDSKPSP